MKKQKFTNEFKLETYESGMLKEQSEIGLSLYYLSIKKEAPHYVIPHEQAIELHEYYSTYYALEYECAKLINTALRKKSRRIKKWALKQLCLFDELYFITINFNERTYQKNFQKKLKKIALKYLNSLNCNYCYCLGIGDENNRLHYHAIITKKPQQKKEEFGYVYYEKIADVSKGNKELLLEYIKENKFNLNREKLLFNVTGQIARYMAHNSYKASLVLNKQQRIIFVEKVK